jgi:AcrR family transcriptional regulator
VSARRSDTRERMLNSAATLMRERGASGTSVDDILSHSGAPRGSIYHHFPGGRSQIIEEAVDLAGASIGAIIAGSVDATPVQMLDAFLAEWRANLAASDFRAGCPVLAVAIESGQDTAQLTDAAARAFGSWREALAQLLRRNQISPAHARRLATLIVASVEGAVALCRVERSLQPLDDVGRELRALLQEAAPGPA